MAWGVGRVRLTLAAEPGNNVRAALPPNETETQRSREDDRAGPGGKNSMPTCRGRDGAGIKRPNVTRSERVLSAARRPWLIASWSFAKLAYLWKNQFFGKTEFGNQCSRQADSVNARILLRGPSASVFAFEGLTRTCAGLRMVREKCDRRCTQGCIGCFRRDGHRPAPRRRSPAS